MDGKSSPQIVEWVEVKPKRRLNAQQKAGKVSALVNSGLNFYTGIASNALSSQAMSILGLEKPRNLAKIDTYLSWVGSDQGQQILSSLITGMDKTTSISVHREDKNDRGNTSPFHIHTH